MIADNEGTVVGAHLAHPSTKLGVWRSARFLIELYLTLGKWNVECGF